MTTSDLDDLDLREALAGASTPSVDDLLRAWREAGAAPPPEPRLLPEPTYPYGFTVHRMAGTIRWSCVHRCGWSHEENPGQEVATMRVVLPAGFSSRDIGDQLTAQAKARHEAMRRRVEDAFTDHYASAHPERQRDARA